MSILTGNRILKCVEKGLINISPFWSNQVNQGSYDVRLGSHYGVYRNLKSDTLGEYLDSKLQQQFEVRKIPSEGLVIRPGQLYLMHTDEILCTQRYFATLDGKSSLGRLGLVVHSTAGFIEPGFDGQVTLEVAVLGPGVKIYRHMRIGQLRFTTALGKIELYGKRGHYVGQDARGPVPSMSWKQFLEEAA